MKKIVLASLLALTMGAAYAEGYVGASVGLTNYSIDCAGTETCDNSDSGAKVYAGFAFTPNLAAEIGYLDFGTAKASVYDSHYGVTFALNNKATAITAALAARGAFTPALEGVARLGLAQVKTTMSSSVAGYGHLGSDTETKAKAYFGLALEYAFSKHVKGVASADFTQSEIYGESASLRMVSAGVQYNF